MLCASVSVSCCVVTLQIARCIARASGCNHPPVAFTKNENDVRLCGAQGTLALLTAASEICGAQLSMRHERCASALWPFNFSLSRRPVEVEMFGDHTEPIAHFGRLCRSDCDAARIAPLPRRAAHTNFTRSQIICVSGWQVLAQSHNVIFVCF
jgi:hypothetical protein